MTRPDNLISSALRKTREAAGRHRVMKTCYYAARSGLTRILYAASPALLARLRYFSEWHRLPDLKQPCLFDEKLLWIMLYWRDPLKTHCADKYSVRSYVTDRGFAHVLPRLHGVFEKSDEIDFRALPDRFVLKCTHGCKCNLFCRDRKSFDVTGAKRALDSWMKVDFSKIMGELHYARIQPRIICEELLDGDGDQLPWDYKVYCFHGKAHCTLVCSQRTVNGTSDYDFYDREWQEKLPYSRSSQASDRTIARPAAYDEMLEIAEELSQPFPFVRIDFYSIKGRAILGEMTFTPSACIDTGYTDLAEERLGSLIRLPEKRLPGR